jgi:hypothetical protein
VPPGALYFYSDLIMIFTGLCATGLRKLSVKEPLRIIYRRALCMSILEGLEFKGAPICVKRLT